VPFGQKVPSVFGETSPSLLRESGHVTHYHIGRWREGGLGKVGAEPLREGGDEGAETRKGVVAIHVTLERVRSIALRR
jgi:hypothetical protein